MNAEDKSGPPGNGPSAPMSAHSGQAEGQAPALGELAWRYLRTLLGGGREAASAMILAAVDQGMPVREVYLEVFQPVQWEVGRLWEADIVSVTMEHFCTAATQMIMSQLFPGIVTGKKNGLSMVGACVGDDLHELGIRMVCDFFEMASWETHYLGANRPTHAVLETLDATRADVLCLSVTMAHNLAQARTLIRDVAQHFPRTRIMAGGLPFLLDRELPLKIGAHGGASNAQEAVELAASLCRGVRHG